MISAVRGYSYAMGKEQYQILLKELGSKNNVITYINENYSLMRFVTDIRIERE